LEVEYQKKTARLKDKVTIAQEESIPNIWNGTMFGDLDWPLNASRRFVSISWASCPKYAKARGYVMLVSHYCWYVTMLIPWRSWSMVEKALPPGE